MHLADGRHLRDSTISPLHLGCSSIARKIAASAVAVAAYLVAALCAGWVVSILLAPLDEVRSLADGATVAGDGAPWEEAGRLIARAHRAGLDHADLNAHNLLFTTTGRGWIIDLDRGRVRIPATGWRERNLARLKRSLLKLRGTRTTEAVERDYARLRAAYDRAWERGY